MHALEHCHLYAIDAAALAADGSRSPQEACAHIFAEARKTLPAVVMLPAVDSLLLHAEPALLATLGALVSQRPASLPLLVLGTCAAPLDAQPPQLQAELRALLTLALTLALTLGLLLPLTLAVALGLTLTLLLSRPSYARCSRWTTSSSRRRRAQGARR